MAILLPQDKQISPEERFRQFVRVQLYNQEMNLINLQNNFIALKNISKISDEKIQTELTRMNDELKLKNVRDETKQTIKELAK